MPPPGAAKKGDEQKGDEGARAKKQKQNKRGNALDFTIGVRVQEVGRHELTLEVTWQVKRTKTPLLSSKKL